ncbi:hypothetical protein HY256_12650, partial [Candidatus Sumerlaeota bacterium]|nr:hypothetical protein [Candidatus Sumerlaeota bacterium]
MNSSSQITASRLISISALVVLFSIALAARPARADDPSFHWKRTVINLQSNFEAAGVADINRDGKLDIICGDTWYAAPNWERHEICPIPEDGGYRIDFANVPMDVNGDGW